MTEAEYIIIEFRWCAVCVASLLLIQSDFRVQEQNKIEKKVQLQSIRCYFNLGPDFIISGQFIEVLKVKTKM